MRSLLYTLILLAVLVACVLLLHSIEEQEKPPVARVSGAVPMVESAPPQDTGFANGRYEDAEVGELYVAGVELLSLWHVREATDLFERAVAADSSHYGAHVKLVECYASPLVGREDSAIEALENARYNRLADADTAFLAGLENLFIDRDFAAASAKLGRAEKSEVSHTDAEYYTALALFKSGKIAQAREKLDNLLNGDETDGRVIALAVRCAAADDDLGAAGEYARDLARMYAEEPYPYVILAMVELMKGKEQVAVEFCNNALVLDSKYIPAILARANLYAAGGEFEAARVSFEKLLLFDDRVLRVLGHEGIGFVDLLSGQFNDGVGELDEAIRYAMLAGAVRGGLTLASQTIGYLCELGQGDSAASVLDRWVTGFGEIPVSLGKLRIQVLEGDNDAVRRVLVDMQSTRDWAVWMGMMSIDFTEMNVLAYIGAEEYKSALDLLSKNTVSGAVRPGTYEFLRGYAAFQSGDAENASVAFADAGRRLYGVEFPYHGDPVLYVRSLFYRAETGIASGNEGEAMVFYEEFLEYWGEADWDIQAVVRAREKLENLTSTPSPN